MTDETLSRLKALANQVYEDLREFATFPPARTAERRGKINAALADIVELLNDFEIK